MADDIFKGIKLEYRLQAANFHPDAEPAVTYWVHFVPAKDQGAVSKILTGDRFEKAMASLRKHLESAQNMPEGYWVGDGFGHMFFEVGVKLGKGRSFESMGKDADMFASTVKTTLESWAKAHLEADNQAVASSFADGNKSVGMAAHNGGRS